jgi:enoyl-CoA hydratase/carnithine racemase
MERDDESGIARITLDNPARKNAYDPDMRRAMGGHLDELAFDDAIKVVVLRGADGIFSTGADMNNAYAWYGDGSDASGNPRRPSQRRRLLVDRKTFDFYHAFLGYPKVTVAEVSGFALGGGFELALMADIAVVARDTVIGTPATRFLGPALGSLHLFFHRLGPVLARRLLLTGDTWACSPRWSSPTPSRPGRRGGPRRRRACPRTASSWPRRRSAWSSSCRATRARRC